MKGGDREFDDLLDTTCGSSLNGLLDGAYKEVSSGLVPEYVYDEYANNWVVLCSYARKIQNRSGSAQGIVRKAMLQNVDSWNHTLKFARTFRDNRLAPNDPRVTQFFAAQKQLFDLQRQAVFDYMINIGVAN